MIFQAFWNYSEYLFEETNCYIKGGFHDSGTKIY